MTKSTDQKRNFFRRFTYSRPTSAEVTDETIGPVQRQT